MDATFHRLESTVLFVKSVGFFAKCKAIALLFYNFSKPFKFLVVFDLYIDILLFRMIVTGILGSDVWNAFCTSKMQNDATRQDQDDT